MTNPQQRYDLNVVLQAATDKLVQAGASQANAASAAKAMVMAEAEANPICGLFHLPAFIRQIQAGRVDGGAVPQVLQQTSGAVVVDACHGMAHPAFDLGLPILADKARTAGVAALSVINSYHALALGQFTALLAQEGLVALMVSNAPGSVAPLGAKRKLYGTNPLSLAAPLSDGGVLLIDQSASATTKTAMEMKAKAGEPIPDGWAQTADGVATNDAAEGLKGSILPNGGTKGANIAMIVEILSAMLTGGSLSAEAPMLGDETKPNPALGQLLIAFDPSAFGANFALSMGRFEALIAEQEGLRLPGTRRRQAWADSRAKGLALKAAHAEMLGL